MELGSIHLSPEDQDFLRLHKDSEFFRVVTRVLVGMRTVYYSKLLAASAEELPIVQGALQALQSTANLLGNHVQQAEIRSRIQPANEDAERRDSNVRPMVQGEGRTTRGPHAKEL